VGRGKRLDDSQSRRPLRVGESIRHALGSALLHVEISEIDVPITITEVQMSPDLRYANVFVYPLGGDSLEYTPTDIIDILDKYKYRLIPFMKRAVKLRYIPQICFMWDDTFDYSSKIHTLLNEHC